MENEKIMETTEVLEVETPAEISIDEELNSFDEPLQESGKMNAGALVILGTVGVLAGVGLWEVGKKTVKGAKKLAGKVKSRFQKAEVEEAAEIIDEFDEADYED